MSIAICLKGFEGIVLATDSRVISRPAQGLGQTHDDGVTKLWSIGNNFGVAGVGNLNGYEARIVYLFKRQILDGEIQETDFSKLVERFAGCLKVDWDKCTAGVNFHGPISQYFIEFVLAGYNEEGQPIILNLDWDYSQQIVTAKPIMRQYHIAGIPFIARYWIKELKVGEYLPMAKDQTLKRIAAFLISESALAFDDIGGDIQMLLIKKDAKLQWIDKIEIETILEYIKNAKKSNLTQLLTEA